MTRTILETIQIFALIHMRSSAAIQYHQDLNETKQCLVLELFKICAVASYVVFDTTEILEQLRLPLLEKSNNYASLLITCNRTAKNENICPYHSNKLINDTTSKYTCMDFAIPFQATFISQASRGCLLFRHTHACQPRKTTYNL